MDSVLRLPIANAGAAPEKVNATLGGARGPRIGFLARARLSPKPPASRDLITSRMVLSLSEPAGETTGGRTPVRVTLFGSYACVTARSMWPLVAAVGHALGEGVDLRFGHVVGAAVDATAALRLAEAAEAACGQGAFGRMHAWLMEHPERHESGEASEWADELGFDVSRFRADLWEGAPASVRAHQVAARALGAEGAPSLWMDGARYRGSLNFTSLLRACHAAAQHGLRDCNLDPRDEWLALAAHELRSPLATLSTLTEMMMAAKGSSVARGDAHLAVVRGVVRRMSRLIMQLTTTAALTGNHMQPPPCERVDLVSVVREVVAGVTYDHAVAANLVIHSALPVYGMWPTGWVEQIIANLIGNALKFAGASRIDVEIAGDATSATLVVRDQGPGLALEDFPRLVRAYERGSDTGGVSGLGLGLHIVHMLVAAMGGRLSVESSLGHGAAFRAEWPIDTSLDATKSRSKRTDC